MQIAQVHDAVPKKFMSFFHSPRENETRRQMTITYPEASKGQLFRKDLLKFSFAPKNKHKYFCISTLASKKRSNQKIVKIRALCTTKV